MNEVNRTKEILPDCGYQNLCGKLQYVSPSRHSGTQSDLFCRLTTIRYFNFFLIFRSVLLPIAWTAIVIVVDSHMGSVKS